MQADAAMATTATGVPFRPSLLVFLLSGLARLSLAAEAGAGVEAEMGHLAREIRAVSMLGSQARLDAIKSNMTVEDSFKRLPPLPSHLTAFIASKFRGHANVQLMQTTSRHRHLRSKKANKTSTKDVDSARVMLNDFIEETVERLDTEEIRCDSDLKNQRVLLAQIGQDLADYSSQASAADADIIRAQTNIEQLRVTRENLEQELKEHQRICDDRIRHYNEEISVMEADAEVMASIVDLTSCNTAGAVFVQCRDTSHRSIVKFASPKVQQKMELLKSNQTRQKLQAAMASLYQTGEVRELQPSSLMQVSTERKRRSKRHLRHAMSHKSEAPGDELMPDESDEESCTLASNPNCEKLLDKFMELSGSIESDLEKFRSDLESEEKRCKDTKSEMDAQISDLEERSMNWETSLAEATSRENHAQQMMTEKEAEKQDVQKEFDDMSNECKTNIETCESEMCALSKIRGELYKMSDTNPYIIDCKVSGWTAGECSATCGGGVHNFTRTVVVPAEMGADCPPLELEQQCNVQECPIDCSISEWSGWSACSAKCGGGVRERLRTISQHARFGGRPCGMASQTEPCNMQACDEDCVLGPWTKEYLAKCSKACDGGVKRLTREVDVPAVGMGACPSEDSPERLDEVPCNTHACEPSAGDMLQCNSKVDIIILLDGSGSLGEEGWGQTKEIAKLLVEAFNAQGDEGTMVGTLLFSGPQYWSDYYRCLGMRLLPGEQVNMETQCGMEWVQHLTGDTSGTSALIDGLAWPAMTTFTSEAIMYAGAELPYGRADAEKVLIIITDGVPLNEWHTGMAAAEMKRHARLMWVPVGENVPIDLVNSWASKPVTDNVVQIKDFESMTTSETINKIVADACPEVL